MSTEEEERKYAKLQIIDFRAKPFHGGQASSIDIIELKVGSNQDSLLERFVATRSGSPQWINPNGEPYEMLLRPTTILVFKLDASSPSQLETRFVSILKEVVSVIGESLSQPSVVSIPLWTKEQIDAKRTSVEDVSGLLRFEVKLIPPHDPSYYNLPSAVSTPDLHRFDPNETTGTSFLKVAYAFVDIVQKLYVEPFPPVVQMTRAVLARSARYHCFKHQNSRFPQTCGEDVILQLKELLLVLSNSPKLDILRSQTPTVAWIDSNWYQEPMYNDSLSLDSRKGMMEATKRGSPHNPQAQLRIQIIREVFKCAIILDNVMHTYSTLTYDYLITRRDMRTEIPERQRELFALRVRVLALFANSWWIPESLLDRPSMIRLLLRPIGEGEESGLLHELRPYTTAIVSARGYEADEVQTLILEEINKLSPCSQKDHYRRLLTRLAQRADRLQVRTLMLKNVKKGEWLGAGAFADVYKGEWERSAVVIKAVKELKEKPSEDNVRGKICLEIITWATVKHPYLLALRGISDVEGVGALCMISPFMAGKTATERCSPPPEGLTHGHRRRLIKEIAEGMTYLHAEGIIHGDLRGPNIFITEAGHAQIADFGLAVYASGVSQNYLSMRIGNARWIAPELMDQTLRQQQKGDTAVFGRPTMQSDMYSFACTCTEILDGLIPYHNLLGETAVIHFVTTKQADGKYGRPGRPAHLQGRDGLRAEEEDEVLWGVIQRCWDPEQRPTFAEVAVMLSTLFLLS